MNIISYLESRFVSSQCEMSQKSSPSSLAFNQAVRTWLWIAVMAMTVFYVFAVLADFMGVSMGLITRPRSAQSVMDEFQAKMRRQMEEKQKFMDEATTAALKARAEQGMDEIPKKGNA